MKILGYLLLLAALIVLGFMGGSMLNRTFGVTISPWLCGVSMPVLALLFLAIGKMGEKLEGDTSASRPKRLEKHGVVYGIPGTCPKCGNPAQLMAGGNYTRWDGHCDKCGHAWWRPR